MYGSSGHRERPVEGVVQAYSRRGVRPDRHVKCFIQPQWVSQSRNPHSWFYRGARNAVNERGRPVFGSLASPVAERAWINHYYCKSAQDYLERAQRKMTQDKYAIKYPASRRPELMEADMARWNDVEDRSAAQYFALRTAAREKA
jgi:hypothetical protein